MAAPTYMGRPCRRGHSGERFFSGHCCACRRKEEADRRKQNVTANRLAYAIYYKKNAAKLIAKTIAWREANRNKCRAYNIAYYAVHKEKAKAAHKEWVRNNKDMVKECFAKWKKNNPEKLSAKYARRRAALYQRTPQWADHSAINMMYRAAAIAEKTFTEPVHVDHDIPLRGKLVSGLHVHQNLKLLFEKANQVKHNTFKVVV